MISRDISKNSVYIITNSVYKKLLSVYFQKLAFAMALLSQYNQIKNYK